MGNGGEIKKEAHNKIITRKYVSVKVWEFGIKMNGTVRKREDKRDQISL